MKIFLYVPGGEQYIRDDRCQVRVKTRIAENLREPLDLLYLSGLFIKWKHQVFLRDYSAKSSQKFSLKTDLNNFAPDCIYLQSNIATFFNDIEEIIQLDKINLNIRFVVIRLAGASRSFLDRIFKKIKLDFKLFILKSEVEVNCKWIFRNFDNKIFSDKKYVLLDNTYTSVDREQFDFNEYINPPRNLLVQNDYLRPDNAEAMAYIYVSRGCPYKCVFCAAPVYLNNKVETRAIDNVFAELKECVKIYKLRNFFFRSDNFTQDRDWVISLCKKIINNRLKIKWITNSRVNTIDDELLRYMAKSGCEIIGFGVESGSDYILQKMKKDINVSDIGNTIALVKKHGIWSFFHLLIGLPWDNLATIAETQEMILNYNPDFIEVNVPYPLPGTFLYDYAKRHDLFISDNLKEYSHIKPILRTFELSAQEVEFMRNKLLRKFYLRSKYFIYSLRKIKSFKTGLIYFKRGLTIVLTK